MFKIASIQTESNDDRIRLLADRLEDIQFSIEISRSNSKQLDSDIDERIFEVLKDSYKVNTNKSYLNVAVDSESIGKLDCRFSDLQNTNFYVEVEKSNKKTLWFDYVKILTCLTQDQDGLGVLICPINYAHKMGVWNLYKEAVIYKKHLMRVFNSPGLERVAVIGYKQYASINGSWQEYDSEIVAKIKYS